MVWRSSFLIIVCLGLGVNAFSPVSRLPMGLSSRSSASCSSRLRMQWSDEERAAKAKAQAERNARLVREREERQRLLTERDQSLAQQRLTSPQNMDAPAEKQYVMDEGNYGDNAGGLFGWANNNPSSKSAIYDTEFINSVAGGAGTGEMVIEMRGKGKTAEGGEVTIKGKDGKDVRIYYRKRGQAVEGQAPVLMVHGILDHSWSWREMQEIMEKDGVQSYALDMPGCGYSSWPQPGFDYEWSEEGVKQTLDRFVDAAGIDGPVTLMVQGFVYGQYAMIWGLENADKVQRIIVLNTPIQPGTALPFVLQQYQMPIVASFVAQDAMRAERFLEGGCAYAIDPADCDRYREPFLESMMPGLGVTDLMKRFDMEKTLAKAKRLASQSGPSILVAWAQQDKYMPADNAAAFCADTGANYVAIPGEAGYLANVDFAQSTYNTVKTWCR